MIIWLLASNKEDNSGSTTTPQSTINSSPDTSPTNSREYYSDANGIQYQYYYNENGAVLETRGLVVYVGKDCDTYAQDHGVGTWLSDKSGFFVQVGDLSSGCLAIRC